MPRAAPNVHGRYGGNGPPPRERGLGNWPIVRELRIPRTVAPGITVWAMETLFSVLQVVISVIVVFLVLMHSGKDSGLSGAFGVGSGTGPLGGGSMVERNLNRWTIFFSILFLLNAIVLLKRPWA